MARSQSLSFDELSDVPCPRHLRYPGRAILFILLALLLALPAFVGRVAGAEAGPPPGFRDEPVADVARPTAMAFAPGGLLLVADKTGQLWVIDGEEKGAEPALDLSAQLCDNRNRGLLGVAVDPNFSRNRAIFLFYTYNAHGECPAYDSEGDQSPDPFDPTVPVSRVSRFTLGRDNTVDPDSEKPLLDGIPSYNAGNHDGGDLGFGKDGYLYVSVGDGDCDLAEIDAGVTDDIDYTKCQAGNPNAQRMDVLFGKILRITRDGGIPRDNPYREPGTDRCGGARDEGRSRAGETCQEIFARGLRNPFRIGFDPNAKGTRFFVNDVGNEVWEEVNAGLATANYG